MVNQNVRATHGDGDTERITLVNAYPGDQVPGVEISELDDLTFLTRDDVEAFLYECGYGPDNPEELVYAFPTGEHALPYGFPAQTFDVPAAEAQIIRDAIRQHLTRRSDTEGAHTMTTYYITEVGEDAGRLVNILRTYGHLKEGKDFKDIGDGRVLLSVKAVDTLWDDCGPEDDGYIDDNDNLWIGGHWYPLRAEGDETADNEISSPEEWADALDREMKRTGHDPGTLISRGYAAGQICGIELDPQNPEADDARGIIAATNGWIVGYDPRARCWTARRECT